MDEKEKIREQFRLYLSNEDKRKEFLNVLMDIDRIVKSTEGLLSKELYHLERKSPRTRQENNKNNFLKNCRGQ